MTMKKSLINTHPELLLESIIESIEFLIYDKGFTNLMPQYEALVDEYNDYMAD